MRTCLAGWADFAVVAGFTVETVVASATGIADGALRAWDAGWASLAGRALEATCAWIARGFLLHALLALLACWTDGSLETAWAASAR